MRRLLVLIFGVLAVLVHGLPARAATAAAPTKVLVIVLENDSRLHALEGMPRLTKTARTYAYVSDYRAVTHPSLPNYLAIAGGSTFGVSDDAGPASHHAKGQSVFDAALASGHTATTYAESMPANCTTVPSGRYAVKHNPWTYFSDAASAANCRHHDVPAGTTASGALLNDVTAGTLPDVGMLVPNLCNDAHDCPLSVADRWLDGWLRTISRGPDWQQGRLAVVVTFDEDDYSAHNQVLTVVIHPSLHHVAVTSRTGHYALNRWLTDIVGAQPMRSGRSARSLASVLKLR